MNQQIMDEDGDVEFNPEHLLKMIGLIKEKEHIDLTLESLYNMIGHKTYFDCRH